MNWLTETVSKDFLRSTGLLLIIIGGAFAAADYLICTSEQERIKWNKRVFGEFQGYLKERKGIGKWPKIAAERFYRLICWTVGEKSFGYRSTTVSVSICWLAGSNLGIGVKIGVLSISHFGSSLLSGT